MCVFSSFSSLHAHTHAHARTHTHTHAARAHLLTNIGGSACHFEGQWRGSCQQRRGTGESLSAPPRGRTLRWRPEQGAGTFWFGKKQQQRGNTTQQRAHKLQATLCVCVCLCVCVSVCLFVSGCLFVSMCVSVCVFMCQGKGSKHTACDSRCRTVATKPSMNLQIQIHTHAHASMCTQADRQGVNFYQCSHMKRREQETASTEPQVWR